jgi:hypothetical protein
MTLSISSNKIGICASLWEIFGVIGGLFNSEGK